MKGRIKRNLTKLLILTMLLTVRSTSVFAEEETPVINLGTFEDVTVSGGLSGGEIPAEDTGKEDRDISKARIYYNYESRYRNKPVELNIICIHEAVSGRHIPESGYRVSYLNNDRPGEATLKDGVSFHLVPVAATVLYSVSILNRDQITALFSFH